MSYNITYKKTKFMTEVKEAPDSLQFKERNINRVNIGVILDFILQYIIST